MMPTVENQPELVFLEVAAEWGAEPKKADLLPESGKKLLHLCENHAN